MQFLKKHYEKLILSLVLLGLAAAAALMPVKVSQERQKEEARKDQLIGGKPKPFPPIDLSSNRLVLQKTERPVKFELAGSHNLFNPVRWQKRPDGGLIKISSGNEVGLGALDVTAIEPLYMTVSLDEISGTGANIRYKITLRKETDRPATPQTRLVQPGNSNSSIFTLQQVQGPPENPTGLVILLPNEVEPIIINKEKPYRRIVGYSADLKYDPENLVRKGMRVKDAIVFGGESYNIVAINQNEVVLSAKSNQKQTTIKANVAMNK
ncbi:MAG: hypothetical protein SFY81_08125 [Verrucomicrobiota bacterium]|nr:hypothetical protein [Verrucomicrobiota bacterium]